MDSLDELCESVELVQAAIQRNLTHSASTVAGKTSGFWADVFAGRRNYPSLNEIMVFRREGFARGIGDERQGSLDRERNYSERMHHIFRRMVGSDFVASIPEPTFGAPLVFEHDGVRRSASFWINAATSRRVKELLDRYGASKPVRVLEIGSGWGACVYQLHHVLDVRNYTVIDLPENLYISAIHLRSVIPQRPLEFIDNVGDPICEIPSNTICACLPGAIGRIRTKYDLVLNSFSLQEMALDSVEAYMDWIRSSLSQDGIFISINSHAKAGVRKPSDYGYEKFHIHHWGVFRPSPSGFFNTIPYEVVLGRRRPDSPDYPAELQDGLGWLMQIGLDQDLRILSKSLVEGSLSAEQRVMLTEYGHFFSARDDVDRLRVLERVRALDVSPIWPFVASLLALVRDDLKACRESMGEACRRGLSGFAKVRAEVLLAGLARKAGRPVSVAALENLDPVFAYPEAAAIVSTGDLASIIGHMNRVLNGA
jgi:putative sugar O-methyltransferase